MAEWKTDETWHAFGDYTELYRDAVLYSPLMFRVEGLGSEL